MISKDNTKIFIDTNIFLYLYNSNESGNVKALMSTLHMNKDVLITTEQSINEYRRNRSRIINDFRSNFIASQAKEHTSSFVRALKGHQAYSEGVKELKKQHKQVIAEIDKTLSDPKEDYIYEGFMKLWKKPNTILTTGAVIDAANRRKILGNPPGGDKYSGGDEVIWEALLSHLNGNLIVVSKDRTYEQNKEYLKYEYNQEKGHELHVCDTIRSAFGLLDIEMDEKAIEAEDNVRWLDIIIRALTQLGGRATLIELYEECRDLVALFYTDKQDNNTIDSTVRRTIYQHSSDTTSYLGKDDVFHQVDSGIWQLRDMKASY